MALSQVQIIRSLADALAWFEKELGWNVEPAELRHLSGRIGELYAAMITRGQMALATNQAGYDVVGAEGERISVKTVTTSTHVTFRRSTFDHVDRVMVLRIVVDESEASIQEVFDGSADALRAACKETAGDYTFMLGRPGGSVVPVRSLDMLAVVARAESGPYAVIQYENGTVIVEEGGERAPFAAPLLRRLAAEHGVSLVNQNGNPRNTRQLGAEVIAAVRAEKAEPLSDADRSSSSRDRFVWNEGDVEMLDEEGQPMTIRQVREAQLIRFRSEVEEDIEENGDTPAPGRPA